MKACPKCGAPLLSPYRDGGGRYACGAVYARLTDGHIGCVIHGVDCLLHQLDAKDRQLAQTVRGALDIAEQNEDDPDTVLIEYLYGVLGEEVPEKYRTDNWPIEEDNQ